MKYKFRAIDLWEELKSAVGDIPLNIIDSGNEIIIDTFERTLTPAQELALTKLMNEKPMLRGKLAKFIEKGLDVELTV